MNTLKGKWVLVTGAASGIGLECALAYARRGANLVLTDINEESLARARERLAAQGSRSETFICDVSSESSVAACAVAVDERIGVLDVLVNNAGIYYLGGFLETLPQTWQRMYQINVMGAVHMCRAFLPAMRAADGPRRIVNIASLSSFLPAPNISAYAMSKHAVLGVSEVLAMELAGSNVGVTVVCPGIINTPLLGGSAVGANITQRQLDIQKAYYRDHGCHPAVVAEAVVEATLAGKPYVFVGPKARLGYLAMRLSRRFARAFSLREARTNGYLDPGG